MLEGEIRWNGADVYWIRRFVVGGEEGRKCKDDWDRESDRGEEEEGRKL